LKIILFRKGRDGIAMRLPEGLETERQFELLLGGPFLMKPIGPDLLLVKLTDGEKLGLPENYMLCRAWADDEPICGDCAVVAVDGEGQYKDVTEEDMLVAAKAVAVGKG